MNCHAANFRAGKEHRESRCRCGQLVAKLRADGVEVKCKRCKRIVLVPYTGEQQLLSGSSRAQTARSAPPCTPTRFGRQIDFDDG